MGSFQILRRAFTTGARYSLRSPNSWGNGKVGARSMSTKPLEKPQPPWLMLPPAIEGGDMVYNFYSLSEDKVWSFNKSRGGESPDDDAKFVGSSHGWLALFNQRNNDLFLSNPITQQNIKLPPVDTLPDPEINLTYGHGSVSKVILSSSPFSDAAAGGGEHCRALISYGPGNRMAFCSPGRSSTRWTPIGDKFLDYHTHPTIEYAIVYEDIVYSWGDDMFMCITNFDIDLDDWDEVYPQSPINLEYWDLRNPTSPNLDRSLSIKLVGKRCDWWVQNAALFKRCIQIPYLVVYTTETSEDLFLAIRFVVPGMGPDGSYGDKFFYRGWHYKYPYKTLGFSVFKVDEDDGSIRAMSSSSLLDGLAMFVGNNHAFAVPAAEFAGLKPNAIYFTDPQLLTPPDSDRNITYGGHDIGVFDYQNKTISSCYHYPCQPQSFQRIVPPPMWFTPRFF